MIIACEVIHAFARTEASPSDIDEVLELARIVISPDLVLGPLFNQFLTSMEKSLVLNIPAVDGIAAIINQCDSTQLDDGDLVQTLNIVMQR